MTRRTLLSLAAAGAFAAERKNRAPVSHEVLRVKLPEAEPVKLPNGMTLLLLEDNRLPLAYVRAQIEGAGMIYASQPGLAEVTVQLLTEGAGLRSGKQFVEEAARLGATFNTQASFGAETAQLEGSGLTSHFDEWLTLMADALLRPTFPADEFNIVRQRLAVGLRLRRANASVLVDDLSNQMLYGSHPAANPVPAPEAMASLKLEMTTAWYRERFAPASTVVSVAGRIRQAHVVKRFEELFGDWKTTAPAITLPPAPAPLQQRRVLIVDRPGAQQTQVAVAGLLFDRRDPDYIPMSVLSPLLGGGGSSRLFRILRGEKRYAFDVAANYTAPRFAGNWRVRAGIRTDATADAVATILAELQRICDEPVPAAEMDEMKSAIIGQFALRLEQPLQVIGYSYLRFRYGFSPDYWERYPEKIGAVSASEIQAVARKYMNPAVAQIAVVGDAARIRADLAKFGPVELQTL